MRQARGDVGDVRWHEHEAGHTTYVLVHLQGSARPWLLAIRWVKASASLNHAVRMPFASCAHKWYPIRNMCVFALYSGGDQSEHSREMKARALQQVVDSIHRNQYQAAVTEVPFVEFMRALSEKSSSNKQMLVF